MPSPSTCAVHAQHIPLLPVSFSPGRLQSLQQDHHTKELETKHAASPSPLQIQKQLPGPNGLKSSSGSIRVPSISEGAYELKSLCDEGRLDKAMDFLQGMDEEGSVPSKRIYWYLLQACVRQRALAEAEQVHAHMVENGMDLDPFLGETLVNTLIKCGGLADAVQVFQRLPQRTAFSWTALISGYCKAGRGEQALQLYDQMQEGGVQPDRYTFVSLLKACGSVADLAKGRRIHEQVVLQGCGSELFVGTALVDMYARCGSMADAQRVFDHLPEHDVVSWTAMIAGYSQQDQGEEALRIYAQMQQQQCVSPNAYTYSSLLQACSSLADKEVSVLVDGQAVKLESLERGKAVHAAVVNGGYESDLFVGSGLVTMYAKCGSIQTAQAIFDRLSKRDLVSWNAMLAGYAQQEQGEKAVQLYNQMQALGVCPNDRTFVSVLQACGSLAGKEDGVLVDGQVLKAKSLKMGQAIHADAARMGYESNPFVASTLVGMYAKCGSILDSQRAFCRVSRHDVVIWNSMLTAYALEERGEIALQLYAQMQVEGVRPNKTTYLSVLKACSYTGALNICSQIHRSIIDSGYEQSLPVATSLIHAYSKCGSMMNAREVFHTILQPDMVAWNALLAGYAQQGEYEESVCCFEELCSAGMQPDGVSFLLLLSVCNHAGMVYSGLQYFKSMTKDYGIPAGIDHYSSVVDLVGRAGLLSKAEALLFRMPMQPNYSMWMSLLGACRKYGDVHVGQRAFDCAVRLQPKEAAPYVLMSSIYAQEGMWELAGEMELLRQRAGASKHPGHSWIEHENEVHTFVVGDRRHKQSDQVYGMLQELNAKLESIQHGLVDASATSSAGHMDEGHIAGCAAGGVK